MKYRKYLVFIMILMLFGINRIYAETCYYQVSGENSLAFDTVTGSFKIDDSNGKKIGAWRFVKNNEPLINYDKDLLIFFYLRFIFFGFSLILHVIAIFTIIIFISLDSKVEKIKFLEEKFFSTFSKIVSAIFIVWTLGLLCLCVPRMVIFYKNGDKIGKFISTLIYLKSFLLIPVYLNIILVYILHRHQSKSEKKD